MMLGYRLHTNVLVGDTVSVESKLQISPKTGS